MNVFIDANIFLSFYHLTNEDLEELRKALVLHDNKKITLWLPEQVKDEFVRNRHIKIADAVRRFEEDTLNNQIPQMMRGYEEHCKLKDATRSYKDAKQKLKEKLLADVESGSLVADQVVESIFRKASKIEISQSLFFKAKLRSDRGNPPGKVGSYGDALNWECLLESIPSGQDLHIISEDGDYFSKLFKDRLNAFLADEWARMKMSHLFLYKSVSSFLCEHFPSAKLASELEKECAILDLAASSNFAATHSAVARLERYAEFTKTQIDEVLRAAVSNNQVAWIISDEDVSKLIYRILERYDKIADSELVAQVRELMLEASEEVSF
jgi:hypothetical protein